MKKNIIGTVGATALVLCCALSGCESNLAQSAADSPSGTSSEQASSGSAEAEVDRTGNLNFPDVTGSFGGETTIAAGDGDAPSVVAVKVLEKGDGQEITSDDIVLADYTGSLWSDGSIFDSSISRGAPTPFELHSVVRGWAMALETQHVGDRLEIIVPAEYGYGDQAQGDNIPANSDLVFVVDVHGAVDPTDLSALSSAQLTNEQLPAGVTLSGDLGEQPSLEVSDSVKPEEGSTVIAQGNGATIGDGETACFHVTQALYPISGSLQSSWDSQSGGRTRCAAAKELTGHTVGSRLLLVQHVPPEADAASSGPQPEAVVSVIDLVGVLRSEK